MHLTTTAQYQRTWSPSGYYAHDNMNIVTTQGSGWVGKAEYQGLFREGWEERQQKDVSVRECMHADWQTTIVNKKNRHVLFAIYATTNQPQSTNLPKRCTCTCQMEWVNHHVQPATTWQIQVHVYFRLNINIDVLICLHSMHP